MSSAVVPLRRLAPRCLSYRPRIIASHTFASQIRTASSDSKDDPSSSTSNPILEEYRRKYPERKAATGPTPEQLRQQEALMKPGDLSSSSIFEDDRSVDLQKQEKDVNEAAPINIIDDDGRAIVLDPDPKSRERWERKKIIQAIRKSGRLTRHQMIKRTEREHLAKSHNMKTSVKKLGMLARQIAGKSLADALVQMTFSKKKAAKEIHEHLLQARDEAVVMRGMGLGKAGESPAVDNADEIKPTPVYVRTKEGSKRVIEDPTKIYIDQAWVGRGPYGKLPDYRARGRMFLMRTPFTSLSVILKEEATLVREYNDREARRRKRRLSNLWTQLPDRPLQGPRGQYYSW